MKAIPRLLALAVLFATLQISPAAAPSSVNYQGRFTNLAGVPQPGIKAMSLKIHDAPTAGTLLYSESVGNVTVDANGVYGFQFGASGAGTPANLANALSASAEQWLELTVDGAAQAPRQKILAVPFALTASGLPDGAVSSAMIADGAVGLSKITGLGTAATLNTGTTEGTIPLLTTGGKLPVGAMDNAGVNAAIAADPTSTLLNLGVDQRNNLGLATSSFRGARKDLRVVTFGDSLVNVPPLNLSSIYSPAGGYCRAVESLNISGSSTVEDWTYPSGVQVVLSNGATRRWGVYNVSASDQPFFRASQFKIYYAVGPGTLRLRSATGTSTSFSDIAGHTAIDTSVGTTGTIAVRTVSMSNSNFYRIDTVSDSGTIKIIGVEAIELTTGNRDSYRVMNLGLGGSFDSSWVQTTQANWTAMLSSMNPHLIVIKAWEDHIVEAGTDWSVTLDRIRTAAPNALMLLVGTSPNGGSTSPTSDPSGWDAAMKAYALARQPMVQFADIRRYWPSCAEMLTAGLIGGDGIHLTESGAAYQNSLLLDAVPTLTGPPEFYPTSSNPVRYSLSGCVGTVEPRFLSGPSWKVIGDLFNTNGDIGFANAVGTAANFTSGPTWRAFASNASNFWVAGGFALGGTSSTHQFVVTPRNSQRSMFTSFGNAESTLLRDPSARLEILSVGTIEPALTLSAPSNQTGDILEIRTASSLSTSGNKVAGVRFDGIPFIPSFTMTARDALTSVPAGSVILNSSTGKLNFYTGSAWESVTSAP